MFIDTYEAPEYWHKDAKVILTWLKNKANTKIKNRCTSEDRVIIEVLQLIATNDFQKISKPLKNIIARGFSVGTIEREEIFNIMKAVLTESRGDGNYILNEIMHINDIDIIGAYNERAI